MHSRHLGLFAVLLVACSSTKASDTPAAADAAADAGELPSVLECAGSVTWPSPDAPSVSLGLAFVDYAIDGPKEPYTTQLTLKVCKADDAACASPVATGQTDAAGKATFDVPTGTRGFDGFIDASGGDRMPLLAMFSPPIVKPSSAADNGRGIPSRKTMTDIATALGTSLDLERGHLLLRARNCTNIGASADVTFAYSTADAKTIAYSNAGGAPKVGQPTDATGLGGALNVPPGPITVTATHAPSGRLLGRYALIVRAGTLTSTSAPPTP